MALFKDFKKVDDSTENLARYWDGPSNRFARYFTYWQRGMGWLNEGRLYFYLFGGGLLASEFIEIFGYKIPVELVLVVAVVGIPIIILVGRWDLFKLNKARQFITTQHGNITKFQGHNMQVIQTMLLKALAEKMGVDVKKIEEEIEINKSA